MSKYKVRTGKKVVVEWAEGELTGMISGKTFLLQTPAIHSVQRTQLLDFADAMKKVSKHISGLWDKEVYFRGTKTDPDEPELKREIDLTVTMRLFPKDTRFNLSFTRYVETGYVKATIPKLNLTDLASISQVCFQCGELANLMKKYEKE